VGGIRHNHHVALEASFFFIVRIEMRALSLIALASTILMTDAFAEDVDYTKVARTERTQLAKCFSDMLTVVKRHSLRKHMISFMEAGCASEMRSLEFALVPHVPNEYQHWSNEAKQAVLYIPFVASMEEGAIRLYREQPVSFCSSAACPLDAYRKCLLLQISNEVTRRTEPRDFEKVAQGRCGTTFEAARSTLSIDFVNVQKLQQAPELSGRTRDLIAEAITDIRHEIVISYAEELTKVQPKRKSCRPELCGSTPCLSLDPEPEPEYKCAIGEIQR
jgi:hypothetical protein